MHTDYRVILQMEFSNKRRRRIPRYHFKVLGGSLKHRITHSPFLSHLLTQHIFTIHIGTHSVHIDIKCVCCKRKVICHVPLTKKLKIKFETVAIAYQNVIHYKH